MQYVLVHGAWQGGWCWEFLAKELQKLGHTVSCLDLPGHGKISFLLSKVTYDVYYPCQTINFKSGQFPFLSNPKQLAEILTWT